MRVLHNLPLAAVVGLLLLVLPQALEADEDNIRRALEKEILKHTVSYLRTKLVRCLSHAPTSRTKMFETRVDDEPGDGVSGPSAYITSPPRALRLKRWLDWTNRRVNSHMQEHALYQVDMDVMQNTRDFLYTRILQCMKLQKGNRPVQTGRSQSKVKVRDIFRPTSPPLPVTTQAQSIYARSQAFEVDGRQVKCESVTIGPNGSQLLCRNLWIDDKLRLPNWSLCPPRYDPDAWWQLNSIQSATFQVLDLEGFCQALGRVAGIKGKVMNVKVAWDCDTTKARLKWLDGKWAGEVDDNGFLHDLNCEYSQTDT